MTQELRQKPQIKRKLLPQNKSVFTWAVLVVMGVGIGLISMMLGASYYGIPMFLDYFSSPLLILLNVLPPVILLILAYFISGRIWIGFFITAIIVIGFSVVDFFKIQIRNEPFAVSDFILAGEAGKVMNGYALIINWKIWLAAAYILGGTVFSFLLLPMKLRVKTRLIGTAAVLLIAASVNWTLYASDKVYNTAHGSYGVAGWSNAQNDINRGFVYPFLHSFHISALKPPEDYGAKTAEDALSTYRDDVIAEDRKVNIVSVMLESYADLTTLDAIDFKIDVYGPLHALEKEAVSGSLVVNTFAGGTINTERSFLTGYTALGDFMKPTNSYVYYLRDQGYHAEGVHVGDGWFYDRDIVNPNLGFENYYFLEDLNNSNRTDEFFFSNVFKLFNARDKAKPYFSYNLSYQNHGPYDNTTTVDEAYINKDGLSDESYNILNNYLSGVYDTTQRVAAFVDQFRNINEPVVLVFFGDHMPWLGNDDSVYHELGVNIDLSTSEGFSNFYSTPYVIWANDAAKKALGNNFTGDGGDFSPCFLMNKVFDLCSWSGNKYMKAANDLRAHTSVVNTATGYFSENSMLTLSLSDEAEDVYINFKNIEYYWQHNFVK